VAKRCSSRLPGRIAFIRPEKRSHSAKLNNQLLLRKCASPYDLIHEEADRVNNQHGIHAE
jgi:hypothetical protein